MTTHQDNIPELAADHHHAVDWPRVRRALRLNHPLRTGSTLCTGIALAPWWCGHVVLPLVATTGAGAAIGLATITGIFTTATRTSPVRPLVRRLAAVLTVTAITGTFYAAPVRHLIAAWIMEN